MTIKKRVYSFLSCAFVVSYMPMTHAANTQLHFDGIPAKKVFQTMTGSAVVNEGAAGHLYRKGKSVLCRYVNADMVDKKGHSIAAYDPRRYTCAIIFNKNGLAFSGKNP